MPARRKQAFRCLGSLEREARAAGYTLVAGADEAGRGSLFGPVFAGAVILSPERPIRGLRDSKLLSAGRRQLVGRNLQRNGGGEGTRRSPP